MKLLSVQFLVVTNTKKKYKTNTIVFLRMYLLYHRLGRYDMLTNVT
jgi:hypothetical protein